MKRHQSPIFLLIVMAFLFYAMACNQKDNASTGDDGSTPIVVEDTAVIYANTVVFYMISEAELQSVKRAEHVKSQIDEHFQVATQLMTQSFSHNTEISDKRHFKFFFTEGEGAGTEQPSRHVVLSREATESNLGIIYFNGYDMPLIMPGTYEYQEIESLIGEYFGSD